MNLILSTPTSHGGGLLLVASYGTAHIVVDGKHVMAVTVTGATSESIRSFVDGALPHCDADVWFEDVRERSH